MVDAFIINKFFGLYNFIQRERFLKDRKSAKCDNGSINSLPRQLFFLNIGLIKIYFFSFKYCSVLPLISKCDFSLPFTSKNLVPHSSGNLFFFFLSFSF